MSFFKKLVKGVAFGALVGLTGGWALSLIPGSLGITTLTGAALLKSATIYGAIYGGLQGAAAGLIKKPKMSMGDAVGRLSVSVDPNAEAKWVFGETAAATDCMYSEKIDNNAIAQIIAAAAHEIDSYGDFYIEDELITFTGSNANGDWADVLSIARNLGTQTQAALFLKGSAWPSTAKGLGMAHYGLRWDFSSEKGKKQLANGIPSRITQIIRGCKVYDPRKDSSRGGGGDHRADDQSTWEWSANWALIVAHYLVGWRNAGYLVYGVGVDPEDIDWTSVANMAEVCDEELDGKPRYRVGGVFGISQSHENIIGQLESAVGGKVSKFGGQYFLWVPHNDLEPVGTIDDSMIVADAGIDYSPSGPLESLYNCARGRFVDPSIRFQLAPYPAVEEPAAIAEDGRERVLPQDFSIIQDVEIAQRVAREMVRRTRFTATLKLVVGPIGLALRPFDVVEVNIKETNNNPELFRVIAMQYSATNAVILELLEEDTSIYDVTEPLGPSLVQLDPNAYDPTEAIELTGLAASIATVSRPGGGALDAVRVTWDTPGGFVDFTEVGYRLTISGDFTYLRNSEIDKAFIAPAVSDAIYEIRARHVTRTGVRGEWETTFITTGNAEFDRISFLGIHAPINPQLWIDINPENPLSRIRISAGFVDDENSATPDRMFIFYSVADVPNQIKIRQDAGNKLYLSEAVGEGVSDLFNLVVAPGSTSQEVCFVPNPAADPDLYGRWWASIRNAPGPATPYMKVSSADANLLKFAPDVTLPFVPGAGQLIDVAELDYSDSRTGEFKLAWINGEVVRHAGIQFDGSYYLAVVERGAEGTKRANQTGQFARYFPAPGPQTDVTQILGGEFTESNGIFTADVRVALNLPAQFAWSAVSCCLARSVVVNGRELFVRSPIVDLTIAGPA